MAAYNFDGAFGNVNNALANLGKQNDTRWLREAQADIGTSLQGGDYAGAAQKAFGYGDSATGLGLLKLGEQAKDRSADASLVQGIFGGGAPAATGAGLANLGKPNEIESRFVDSVKGAGLTNPIGLGAVAAYGKAESGFQPQNVNRTWSDPSQSGQAGTAGGIMSWRADRLKNLYSFAQQRGESQPSVETQAAFLVQEDPSLLPKLQAAKSPQEANQIMASAWRFAGYNQPGGENARRLALTQGYAQRYGGQGGAPVAAPVQVAQNEADVARLEAQQGNPVIGSPAPVQVAQAAPQRQGAAEAQFYVPGTDTAVPQSLASNPRIQNLTRALVAARTDGAKTAIKQMLDLEIADAKNNQDQGGPLARQKAQLDIQKSQRELEGKGFRSLITPEEREAAGVDPNYKGSVQVDRDNQLHYPGKPTTEVNIDQKAETAYATSNGKAISDRFKGIVEEGDAANQEAGLLARIRDLGGSIKNMGTGAAIQARLAEAGIKVGENVDEITAYKALIDKLTPTQRIAGAGATSDYDARMFKSALPSLMNRPGGNELIMSTLEALNAYKRQRGDLVAESMATNEKPAEVIRKLRDLPDPFAAFKDSAKSGMKNLPEGTPTPNPVKPDASGWQDMGGGVRIREKR